MSFGLFRKLVSCFGVSAFLWVAMPSLARAQPSCAPCAAQFGAPCAMPGPGSHHCPPAFHYRPEGPPNICWGHACPRPICNPCDLPHWGYYDTCWNPWPFPPSWTHCPTPPPAAFVTLNPLGNQAMPQTTPRNTFGSPQSSGAPTTLAPGNGTDELHQPRRFEEKR